MEEERAKIRVVRCPKCDKLLPELADFTVYRCGGCNATLQAKKRNTTSEASGKSDEESVKYLENKEICSEKKAAVDSDFGEEIYFRDEEIKVKGLEGKQLKESPTSRAICTGTNESITKILVESPENGTNCKNHSSKIDDIIGDNVEEQETKFQDGYKDKYQKNCIKQSRINENQDQTSTYSCANPYPEEGPSNYHQNPSKRKNTSSVGLNRSEFLNKLDELREQLRKSCEVSENPKERQPCASRTAKFSSNSYAHNNWFQGNSSNLNRTYSNHSPSMNNGMHKSIDIPNLYPTYHPYYPAVGRPQPMSNCLYSQFDPDPLISYHHDGFYHQPACSCLHCCNSHLPPMNYNNHRAPYYLNNNNLGFYQADGPLNYRPKHVFKHKDWRMCRPVGGAAPFVSCYNCFELIELPEDILVGGKKRHKLHCGTCLHLISFDYDGKTIVPSAIAQTTKITSKDDKKLNRHPINSYSDSFISNEDEKLVLVSYPPSSNEAKEKEYNYNMSESDKMQGLSSSPSSFDYVESPNSEICQREFPNSHEGITHISSLPLRDHFSDTLCNYVADVSGDGSRSRRSEQEKTVIMNGNLKQNSIKDVLVDHYNNSNVSQDPWEASNNEDLPRGQGRRNESFFAGIMKKSFKDASRGKCKVSINGHLISDRMVKKAEKLAGPIYPGNYWYDYRAGFWGVIGHACQGIIPPFIEEFNYPMPKNCSNGNTGVFVNGRELHERDLSLLVSRGLPSIEDQSYIVEISGKVWDETTGEELDCLGKLAPTIEKVKHGFGMRVPSVAPP